MLARAAKAAGVDLLIWSGLESISKVSGGKYTLADHFESKAAITEYARQSGVPLAVVQAGSYASNFTGLSAPRKQADGSFVVAVPCGSSTVLPVIDMVQDYGIFVREAIESPAFGPGSEILTHGELITVGDCMSQLAESALKSGTFTWRYRFLADTPFPGGFFFFDSHREENQLC